MLYKVKIFFIRFDFFLKNASLAILRSILFYRIRQKSSIRRILIFRTGSLGDSICAMPAIESVYNNFSKAKIDLMTDAGGAGLVSINHLLNPKYIREYIFYKKYPLKEITKLLRSRRYDLFILLPQAHAPFKSILRNLIFAKLIKVKSIIGFKLCVTQVFPEVQAKYSDIPNVRDFLLSLLEKDGIDTRNSKDIYHFNVRDSDVKIVEEMLIKNGVTASDELVSITIGAKRPQHRWPPRYFDEIIRFLIKNSFKCIIVGGPEDRIIAQKLQHYGATIDLTGKLTPIQSGVVISKCKLSVTNDTGPMHLSYAFGTKTLAIFSSRDYPNLWYPPPEISYSFRNNSIHCSECFTDTCTDNQCMKQILPEQVIERLKIELNLS